MGTLTPTQVDQYYKEQSGVAAPLSPNDWLAKQGPAPSSGGNALLVTSGPARAATAANTSKLSTIVDTNYQKQPTETVDQYTKRVTDYNASKPENKTETTTADSAKDPYESSLSGIADPGLREHYRSSLKAIDDQVTQAHANLDNLQRTAQNDPAAQAAISAIRSKFETQANLLRARQTQFLGKQSTAVSAFGGLGPMSQDFLNNQQQKAEAQLTDLAAKEEDLVFKAQIAYKTGNYKDLNAAMTEYDKANKTKLTALNDLLKETNKEVTQRQAEDRLTLAKDKQQVSTDISKSTGIASAIAKTLADSGVTDKGEIDKYITGMAEKSGISNPSLLSSAVERARQTLAKTNSSLANTSSIITKRNQPKSTDNTKFVQSEGIAKVTPQMEGVKGSDGYIDPAKWIAARTNWMSLGGTETSFKSNFIKYLNPASYQKAGYAKPANQPL